MIFGEVVEDVPFSRINDKAPRVLFAFRGRNSVPLQFLQNEVV